MRTRESDQMTSKICKVLQTLSHFISEYVHELMEEAVQLVQRGGKTLRQTIPILSNVPPPLAASLENTPSCKLLLEGKLPDLPI